MPETLNTLKVISRNSKLAFQQVSAVFSLYQEIRYELIVLKSSGVRHKDISLLGNPVQDIFTRELGHAILQNEADLFIHLAEYLPYPLSGGLEIIALIDTSGSFVISSGLSPLSSEVMLFGKHPLQGHLAIISRKGRAELKTLFSKFDVKNQFGKVTLVGFGPGDPDLLTIGGEKALSQADIIFHDDLVDKEFLEKYPAEKVYVGKRKGRHCFEQYQIKRLILDAAIMGKQVVRLKGGDPMIFAHGGEEVEYLQRNLVEVKVIPGVSTGLAVASLSKIPLTQRDISSSVAFISGHIESVPLPDADTLVIYMGGSNIRKIAARAVKEGRDPDMPTVLVYNVSLPDQTEFFFTLKELSQSDENFPTPVIIIIGDVVSLRHRSADQLQKSISKTTDLQIEHYLSNHHRIT